MNRYMQNTLRVSKRAENAPSSPIRKLVPFAEEAKKKGIKVYHVNIGDPDFNLPDTMQTTLKSLGNSVTRLPYTNSKGLAKTVAAWKKYYLDVGIDLQEEEIIVTSGGSEALIITSAVVLDPEDEFIVFEPFYANYSMFANLLSSKVVPVTLNPATGYHLPADEEIVKAITPKTRAIYFTNPNNPTGTVFSKEEVQRVLNIAEKHNLFVVADETYRGMCFEGKKMTSVFDLANEAQKQLIIVVDSVSKRLNACGARVGVIVSKNKDVMAAAFRFAQSRLSPAFFEQELVSPMLEDSLEYLSWLTKQYESRRNVFIDTLEQKLGITIHRPEGAFYTMVPLPVADTDDFAKWLLTDFSDNSETVMVAPGVGFYATEGRGKNEVRVAYVLNENSLKRAAELLALGVKKYSSK